MIDNDDHDGLFRRTCSAPTEGVAIVNGDGEIVFAEGFADYLDDASAEELVGLTIDRLIGGETMTALEYLRMLTGDVTGEGAEVVSVSADDLPVDRPGDCRCSVRRLSGREDLYLVIWRDASDGDTESASEPVERQFRKLLDYVGEAVLLVDTGTDRVVSCNQRATALLERPRDHLLGSSVDELGIEALEGNDPMPEATVNGRDDWIRETVYRTGDGALKPVELSMTGVDLRDGPHLLLTVRDISARARYREQWADSRTLFRTLFEHTDDAVLLVDPETDTIASCNARAGEVLGYEREELSELATEDLGTGDAGLRSLIDDALAEGNRWTDRIELRAREGTAVPVAASAGSVSLAGRPHVLVSFRAASPDLDEVGDDHVAALFERTSDPIVFLGRQDGETVVRRVNPAFEATFDSPAASVVGRPVDALPIEPVDGDGAIAWPTDGGSEVVEVRGRAVDGLQEFLARVVPVDGVDTAEYAYVHLLDITEQVVSRRQLEALDVTTRELMKAGTEEEIARAGLEAIENVLGVETGAVRTYDPETNTLQFAALAGLARDLLDSKAGYRLDQTNAGRAFRRARTERSVETTAEHEERRYLHVPIDNHGVLSVVRDDEPFAESEIRFVELLVANLTAAYDRVEREGELRERERELRRRVEGLERLEEIHELVGRIIRRMVDATTREEVEAIICEYLASSEFYDCAWIGEVEPDGGGIRPREAEGIDEDMLGAFASMDPSAIEGGVIARMLDSGDVSVVNRVNVGQEYATDGSDDGQPPDDPEEVDSTAAVPIGDPERPQAVLVVRSARDDTFEEAALRSLAVLGSVAGSVIDAVRSREQSTIDRVVELVFELTDPNSVLVALSNRFDCRCQLEGTSTTSDGRTIYYLTVEESANEALDAMDAIDAVSNARLVTERAESCRLELVGADVPPEQPVELDDRVRDVSAEDGVARVVVEAPTEADARDLVEEYREKFPDLRLVGERTAERRIRASSGWPPDVWSVLTERQAEALRATYYAGYYEWPRESTAEEITETLGLSSSTLHQHLRAAHRKLFTALLEDPPRISEASDDSQVD